MSGESTLRTTYCKQLLDEVFVISGIIKVKVSVISRSRKLITLTGTLIILDITKNESYNNNIVLLYTALKKIRTNALC